MSPRRALVATAIAALTILALPISASAHVTAGSATIADPVGDAKGAPDITAVTVANDENGTLSFRIAVSNRTGLVAGETSIVFINSDERRNTGTSELFGADVQLVLNGDGSFLMRRWDESTFAFVLVPSPPPSLTAGWSEGYRFSIALSDLGSPKRVEFAAGTRTTVGGSAASDQLNGRYDTQTGVGAAFDPFLDPGPAANPPAAPQRVRASRIRRDGVRIDWTPSDGASSYEIWRSRTKGGFGLRIGTTTGTTFLDKRAARRVAYFYAARAGNADGWSPFSPKVPGGRR